MKSVNDNESIKIKIPAKIRYELEDKKEYIFKGYIDKTISFSTIELVLVVSDFFKIEETKIPESEIKRFNLIQKKSYKEVKNIELVVKEAIYKNKILNITILLGGSAIVDKDFEAGLGESIVNFSIRYTRCNITDINDIIEKSKKACENNIDILAIIRGGGDTQLDLLNEPELGEALLDIQPIFVTALGHTVNETLLDKIADRNFSLPFDFGNKLKMWVDNANEEMTNSKSIFIEQVKQDLQKTYSEQIKTLETQLKTRNLEFETNQKKFTEGIEQLKKEKNETLQAKEKTFEANINTLTEQLKAKEENLKIIKANNETSIKQQIALLVAQNITEKERLNNEKINLTNQLKNQSQQIQNLLRKKKIVTIYILFAVIIGLVIGLILK